jgi:hypothetical protein
VPALVGDLVCRAANAGIHTVVGLELLRADQELLDTYLASADTAANRAAFLSASRSFRSAAASPASTSLLELVDRIRALRDAGLPLRVFTFDEPPEAPGAGRARARTIEHQRRLDLDAATLVLVRWPEGGEAPLAGPLARWGLRPLPLEVRLSGGRAWTCAASGAGPACDEAPVPARPPPQGTPPPRIDLFGKPDADGFLGAFFVGMVTPSPPPGDGRPTPRGDDVR